MEIIDQPAHQSPLKIGVLIDSLEQPAWVRELLAVLTDFPHSRLNALIYVQSHPVGQPRRFAHFLYHLFSRVDRLLYAVPADALTVQPLSRSEQMGVFLELKPEVQGPVLVLSSQDILTVEQCGFDILINLTGWVPEERLIHASRYGLWELGHHCLCRKQGGPAGFWEVILHIPVTRCVLWEWISPTERRPLAQYRSSTSPRSPFHNANHLYWTSIDLLKKKICDLYELGPACLQPPADIPEALTDSSALISIPTNLELLIPLGKFILDRMWSKIVHLFWMEQYEIGYLSENPSASTFPPLQNFTELRPPRGVLWADPFVFVKDKRFFLFFEEWHENEKAHISVLELASNGKVICAPETVLERSYHLSYPHVFEYNQEVYMLPETGQNRTVELYRCVEFPNRWEFHSTLLNDIPAVDATLLEYQGRWWMFVNTCAKYNDAYENHDELHLYVSDTPLGPWLPHRLNPIKLDALSARSAGKIYHLGEHLYRPAQDCSVRYGYATVVHQIITLTSHEYEEKETGRILPVGKPGILGVHTLNYASPFTIIDLLVRRFRYGPPRTG